MADLKCKCSTPYGQGWVIVTCTQSSCQKCCPRTLMEDVSKQGKPTTEVATIVKNNITTNDYIYLNSEITGQQRKIPAPNFFPSINVVGKGSESVWIGPLLQKNQINLKGFKSGDVSKLEVMSIDNNLSFLVKETGLNLSNCNNSVSKFLTSTYLGPVNASYPTTNVTGVLGVLSGGTGLSTMPKGSILYANTATTLAAAPLANSGQLLIGHTTNGYPIPGYITSADSSVTVNNFAGNIDLSVSTLAQLQANIDMGAQNINMNEAAGDSWLTGDGTSEGILIAATGQVLIGDNQPTKPTIAGQLHIAGNSTAAIVMGNANNYKAHTISMADAPASTAGAALSILGAEATSGNSDGGQVSITGGASNANGVGGSVSIIAADAPGSGAGGSILLRAGDSASGTTGTIDIKGYHTDGTLNTIAAYSVAAGTTLGAGLPLKTNGVVYNRGTDLGGVIQYQGAPATAADDTSVPTAANIATGIVLCTPTADRSRATDTAANLVSGLTLSTDGDSFDFSFINLATDGTSHITLTAGTGITLIGCMVISAQDLAQDAFTSGTAQFRIRRTASNAVTFYRIG